MRKIRGTLAVLLLSVSITGCSNKNDEQQQGNLTVTDGQTEIEKQDIPKTDEELEENIVETNIVADYAKYFQDISGCAVIYEELTNTYYFYNKEQCEMEVSPLSTFKIVSTLAGLESGVLTNENTTMQYSGMEYPIAEWNDDLTLKEAFNTSCIWYFRHVIDNVGQKDVLKILNELHYGNCDLSEWNGNNVNPLEELNGFWIESSLKISPVQQVQQLSYIFSQKNNFKIENIEILKDVMYITELDSGILYGKTGSGTNGNAWFVGFVENNGDKIYFAIYLNDISDKDIVNGNKAKEITIDILDGEKK